MCYGQHPKYPPRVHPDDEGQYRCRVDFKSSQTRNSLATLALVSPPRAVTILHQEADREVEGGTVGPVTQGDTVTLTCRTHGAPAPSLAWYRDGVLVDASSEVQKILSSLNWIEKACENIS